MADLKRDPRAIVPVGFAKRLTQAVTYGLTGGWFSPQLPLQPQHQETAGRRFDYLAGYNISTRPRRDSGIDFYSLRNFAKYYDILRILIEKRKDQITNFDWSITPTDEASASGENKEELIDRAAAATKFLKFPDGRSKWNTWLRAVIEDMLVLDGIALWPVYKGKQLLRLELIDPSTIKLVIDESGRTPEPPFPAYQQVLHGIPTADFLKDELMYFISNPASDRIYGLSKVEQILITIQIGLRREVSQLQFFTDGNVPAALAGVPDTWNPQQISIFQAAIDSILAGDTAARRKLWFVPKDTAANVHEFKSEDAILKGTFDEWLIRIMCFTFGIAPTPFIAQVNRATAFTAQEEARDEGLGPQLTFLKSVMDTVIHQGLKLEGIEFKWSMEQENDPETQSNIDDKMLRNGSRSLDELRQRDGLEPYGIGAMIYQPTGPVSIQSLIDGTAPAPGGGGGTEPPNAVDPQSEQPVAGGGQAPTSPAGSAKVPKQLGQQQSTKGQQQPPPQPGQQQQPPQKGQAQQAPPQKGQPPQQALPQKGQPPAQQAPIIVQAAPPPPKKVTPAHLQAGAIDPDGKDKKGASGGKPKSNIDASSDKAGALEVTPGKNKGAAKKVEGGEREERAQPFRKASRNASTWHGYPSGTIRSPKAEAARTRLIKASQRNRG